MCTSHPQPSCTAASPCQFAGIHSLTPHTPTALLAYMNVWTSPPFPCLCSCEHTPYSPHHPPSASAILLPTFRHPTTLLHQHECEHRCHCPVPTGTILPLQHCCHHHQCEHMQECHCSTAASVNAYTVPLPHYCEGPENKTGPSTRPPELEHTAQEC